MKKEDFKEITQEYIKTCKEIIKMEGDCGGEMCDTCPFHYRNTSILIPVEDEDRDEFDCEFYPNVSACSIVALFYFEIWEARYEKCMIILAKQFIDMANNLGTVNN